MITVEARRPSSGDEKLRAAFGQVDGLFGELAQLGLHLRKFR